MKMILLIISILVFLGCPKNNECGSNFYISGKITDQNDVPMQDVEVHYVTHYGFDVLTTTTNASADYWSR